MDAPSHKTAILWRLAALAAVLLVSMGAQQRSANFVVTTPDANFTRQVVQTAEQLRRDLALEWLGKEMPNWSRPCEMTVQIGGGAGGATTFIFDRGEVFNWTMSIQGSRERILDSVLPHEITHMVYASHFRQPLPRWADEGGATSVEHISERNKHRQMLDQFLRTGRGIAFSQMFAMTEYPNDIMPLYAQGYSLAEFLIQTGGRRKYIEFLGDGLQSDDWPGAVQRNYSIQDLAMLQNTWLAWVRQGSPMFRPRTPRPTVTGELLAANNRRQRPEPNLIYHIPSKPAAATPLANLVPVNLPSKPNSAVAVAAPQPAPARRQVSPDKWSDPSRGMSPPADRIAVADPQEPARISAVSAPATGWRAPGAIASDSPSTAPTTDPFSTQVARPQPIEHPRQTILR